jgi:hypothetical protein
MDDIAAKFELRDGVRRREFLALSMEERLQRMQQSHEWKRAQLEAHPAGFQHFLRRNLSKRAITRNGYGT